MSRPRVSLTVAGNRARSSTALKAAIAFDVEPSYIPVGLYGIRFTLKTFGSSSSASARACSTRSLTPRSLERRIAVGHRLPHSHENRVVDRLDAPEVQRLVQDFGGGQIPAEAHLTGCTEGACQRTAGLRRQANGTPAVAIAHQYRLHRMALHGAKQRPDRAVPFPRFPHKVERRGL